MHVQLLAINFKKIAIICACIFFFGIAFGYVLFPMLLKKMMKMAIHLKPDSALRGPYTKAPFGIDFRVYMFNLTNMDEVMAGGKPKVQEIGPYFFEEWKEKYDMVDDEAEDSLTYHFKNTFIYHPEKNGEGLTGEEVIIMPHPLLMGMALATNVDKKPMLSIVAKAISILFNEPTTPFVTAKVMDILYRGIPIDCSSTEFAAMAVCSVFAGGEAAAVRPFNETHYAFSIFAGANGTDIGEFKVFRGSKNYKDVGRVISFNEELEQSVWETVDDDDVCNQYDGTDSSVFPPLIKNGEPLAAWEPSICRSLSVTYRKNSKYAGIPTKIYGLDLSYEDNVKECYCRDPPDGCPPKGTFDLFHCVKAPMLGSLPHFYNADPQLLNNFASGLYPDEQKHDIYLHLETLTGSPLEARRRLQFNLEIVPIEEVQIMSKLQPMLYPLFWVEEAVSLNKTWTKPLKNTIFRMIKITNIIKWLCILGGAIGMIASGVLHYKTQLDTKKDLPQVPTAVRPLEIENNENNLSTAKHA